jgi:hypothetical protein
VGVAGFGSRRLSCMSELFVYSRADVEDDIVPDMFVDFREVMSDETAAEAVDIVLERLTDDFYSHE